MATALITGASGGIGLELAKIFARDRYDLVLVARTEDKLQKLADELRGQHGVQVRVLPADLSRPGAPEDIGRTVRDEGLTIDFLVNNAGFGQMGRFHEADWPRQADMLQVNVVALTHLTRLFVPAMVERGSGRILNLASTAAFQPGPLMSVYYATKAYVVSFSEAIAHELRHTGVTVTALCPGPTTSDFQRAADMLGTKLADMGRRATAQQVAEFGYHAMMKGKRVAIHGVLNSLLAQTVKFAPRPLVTATVERLSQKDGAQ